MDDSQTKMVTVSGWGIFLGDLHSIPHRPKNFANSYDAFFSTSMRRAKSQALGKGTIIDRIKSRPEQFEISVELEDQQKPTKKTGGEEIWKETVILQIKSGMLTCVDCDALKHRSVDSAYAAFDAAEYAVPKGTYAVELCGYSRKVKRSHDGARYLFTDDDLHMLGRLCSSKMFGDIEDAEFKAQARPIIRRSKVVLLGVNCRLTRLNRRSKADLRPEIVLEFPRLEIIGDFAERYLQRIR
jgi:hypothetical protein